VCKQRLEAERLAREEAERLEAERQAKLIKDEEEKLERKKVSMSHHYISNKILRKDALQHIFKTSLKTFL